jgi:hypothetical protein
VRWGTVFGRRMTGCCAVRGEDDSISSRSADVMMMRIILRSLNRFARKVHLK